MRSLIQGTLYATALLAIRDADGHPFWADLLLTVAGFTVIVWVTLRAAQSDTPAPVKPGTNDGECRERS